MKPSPEAIEAAEKCLKYIQDYSDVGRFGTSEHKRFFAEIIQAAIDAAYERGMDDRALKHLMELQKAESRPAQEDDLEINFMLKHKNELAITTNTKDTLEK